MATTDASVLLQGMTGGTTSERNVMNILPTNLDENSRNIEILRDGSLRPRRGADFIDISDSAAYMHTLRAAATSAETAQDSPSGIYAEFKTSDGEIVQKDILFINNVFKIYDHNNLKNFDVPNQTVDPSSLSRINTLQKCYTVSFAKGANKVFFAGRKIQPGYFYLDSDNTTLNVVYLSMHKRDLDNATAISSRVKLNGKYYECIEAHTAAATDLTTTDTYGELKFNRYWMELDNTAIPGGAATWTAGGVYTTNVLKLSDKYQTLASNNPHVVWFWDNRLWLATDNDVYYSQIVVDIEDAKTATTPSGTHEYSLFMQEADPFDTTDPTPVGSDGGIITPEAGKIYDIRSTEDSIFIGTTVHVEEVRGATNQFTHTDFKKGRVINEGINGVDNMVVADNRLYVFANNNIWASVDEQRVAISALTKFAKVGGNKIKTYYTAIPKLNKGTARAVYSPTKDKIYYFHNGTSLVFDAEKRSIPGQNGYARNILVIDISGTTRDIDPVQNETFVQNGIEIWEYEDHASSGGTYIAFAFSAAPTTPSFNAVIAGADTVVVGADPVVVSGLSGSQEGSDEIVLIAMERSVSGGTVTIKGSLAVLESLSLQDWASDVTRSTDYSSPANLGTQVFNDMTATKAIRYIVFVFEKLTAGTGSCLCRTAFGFSAPTTIGEGTGKTSGQVEIYQDTKTVGSGGTVSRANYSATWYKHRVRGRGVSMQVALENTPGKDFKLLGWGELVILKQRG